MHVDIPNPGPDRQQAKQTDIIYNALQKLLPRSMPAISNKYFASSSVRFATKKLILKIRTHSLWTAAYARKINKPYKTSAGSRDDGRCPLCCTSSSPGPPTGDRMRRDPLRDSAAHILGSCRHADMAALYTERHNQALLLVHRALMQSVSSQPCIVIMDATSKAQLPPGIYSNRLPAWLLPSINDTMRSKLRPDLLIIEGICPVDLTSLDLSDPTTALDVRRRCKITIVELGYTIEHNLDEKLESKRMQHQKLVQLLLADGWQIPDAPPHDPPLPPLHDPSLYQLGNLQLNTNARKVHLLILGSTGVIFNHLPSQLRHLGVPHPSISPLLTRLHYHAVKFASTIVNKRRTLEQTPAFISFSSPPHHAHDPP